MNERIKSVRKDAKLTQTEFGERIGASRAMIASYEGGAVVPSDSILKLISKEFNVSYPWLKTGEGNMYEPMPEESSLDHMKKVYSSLPERLISLIDALEKVDPEWQKTLDAAFDELERRHRERDAK